MKKEIPQGTPYIDYTRLKQCHSVEELREWYKSLGKNRIKREELIGALEAKKSESQGFNGETYSFTLSGEQYFLKFFKSFTEDQTANSHIFNMLYKALPNGFDYIIDGKSYNFSFVDSLKLKTNTTQPRIRNEDGEEVIDEYCINERAIITKYAGVVNDKSVVTKDITEKLYDLHIFDCRAVNIGVIKDGDRIKLNIFDPEFRSYLPMSGGNSEFAHSFFSELFKPESIGRLMGYISGMTTNHKEIVEDVNKMLDMYSTIAETRHQIKTFPKSIEEAKKRYIEIENSLQEKKEIMASYENLKLEFNKRFNVKSEGDLLVIPGSFISCCSYAYTIDYDETKQSITLREGNSWFGKLNVSEINDAIPKCKVAKNPLTNDITIAPLETSPRTI